MELQVIAREETELVIEVAGEDHTFMNVLKGALLETDGVTAATYDMNPEQSGGQTEPLLTVKTEGADPLDCLRRGATLVGEQMNEFGAAFEAAR